jgi:hypothetical protein
MRLKKKIGGDDFIHLPVSGNIGIALGILANIAAQKFIFRVRRKEGFQISQSRHH